MTIDGIKIDINSGTGGNTRAGDARSIREMAQNVTIEDRVTSLFATLRSSILAYVVSVFGIATAAEAEDITQDAFLQLHRVLQKGTQIDNPRAWLFRVAHNLAVSRLNLRQFIAPLDDLGWDEICSRIPDPGISPEQRTQRLEDFAHVYRAMARLSVQERQCLHLRSEGLRYKEIGDILGISVPAVGKYLRRAIRKLVPES